MNKIRLLAFSLGLFSSTTGFGEEYQTLVGNAMAHLKAEEYTQAVAAFSEAFTINSRRPLDLYNGACAAARAGDSVAALNWLGQAIERGFRHVDRMVADRALILLHDAPRWTELIAEANRLRETVDKPLEIELLTIHEEDQTYRRQIRDVEKNSGPNSPELKALWDKINEVDAANLVKVKAILDEHGWLGVGRVSAKANGALFLVIQHSDLATQQKYLPMMRVAVEEQKADASSLALLEDRVALGEGRRQKYGSQISRNNETGKYYVLPLEDPDNVDRRRAEVGLPPLAQYVKPWEIIWDAEAYKEQLPALDARHRIK